MSQAAGPFVILMADDDADDCLLLEEALGETGAGHVLRCVGDGEELLDYLNRRGEYADGGAPRPDLILLDLNMPKKDGREVLAEIRADARFSVIPVVVLTTSDSEDDVVYCYRNGASAFVCKPATFPSWVETAQTLCSFWFHLARLPSRQ